MYLKETAGIEIRYNTSKILSSPSIIINSHYSLIIISFRTKLKKILTTFWVLFHVYLRLMLRVDQVYNEYGTVYMLTFQGSKLVRYLISMMVMINITILE